MPGINVFAEGLADDHLFLVCWTCKQVRHAYKDSWVSLSVARQKLKERTTAHAEQ